MAQDNSLTIILTLKDRTSFTWRWFSYANKTKLPFHVIIADGGKDSEVQEVLSDKERNPNIEYEYIRYPYDEGYFDYYSKLSDALARVKTPFVVFADNDDFFLVDGLQRSVDFLAKNPEFSTCRGQIIGFTVNSTDKSDTARLYGNDVKFFLTRSPLLLEEKASDRILCHFSNYDSTFYDVHRTEMLAMSFKSLKEANLSDLYLAELYTSFFTVACGKVQRELYPYHLRQLNTPSSAARSEVQKKGDQLNRMFLKTWSYDISEFFSYIGAAIAEKDNISLDEAEQIVKNGYRSYVIPILKNCLRSARFKTPNSYSEKAIFPSQDRHQNNSFQALLFLFFAIAKRIKHFFKTKKQHMKRVSKASKYFKSIEPILIFLTSQN